MDTQRTTSQLVAEDQEQPPSGAADQAIEHQANLAVAAVDEPGGLFVVLPYGGPGSLRIYAQRPGMVSVHGTYRRARVGYPRPLHRDILQTFRQNRQDGAHYPTQLIMRHSGIFSFVEMIVNIDGADAFVQSLDAGDAVDVVFCAFPNPEWEAISADWSTYNSRLRMMFGAELANWPQVEYEQARQPLRMAILFNQGIFMMFVRTRQQQDGLFSEALSNDPKMNKTNDSALQQAFVADAFHPDNLFDLTSDTVKRSSLACAVFLIRHMMAHINQETRRELVKRARASLDGQKPVAFLVAISFKPLTGSNIDYETREKSVAEMVRHVRGRPFSGLTYEDLMECDAILAGLWSQNEPITQVFKDEEHRNLPGGEWQRGVPKELRKTLPGADGLLYYNTAEPQTLEAFLHERFVGTLTNTKGTDEVFRVFRDPLFVRIHISIKEDGQVSFHDKLCRFTIHAYGSHKVACYYRCIAVVKLRKQDTEPDLIRLFKESGKSFFPTGKVFPTTDDWPVDGQGEYVYTYIQVTKEQYQLRCPSDDEQESRDTPLSYYHNLDLDTLELFQRLRDDSPPPPAKEQEKPSEAPAEPVQEARPLVLPSVPATAPTQPVQTTASVFQAVPPVQTSVPATAPAPPVQASVPATAPTQPVQTTAAVSQAVPPVQTAAAVLPAVPAQPVQTTAAVLPAVLGFPPIKTAPDQTVPEQNKMSLASLVSPPMPATAGSWEGITYASLFQPPQQGPAAPTPLLFGSTSGDDAATGPGTNALLIRENVLEGVPIPEFLGFNEQSAQISREQQDSAPRDRDHGRPVDVHASVNQEPESA
ncbi:hypothetical protein QBC41DRAFT_386606 [Cercophora samala]|uniref:Uncharacterized protein n=1 Tax=Cercophora samala TaxID=330535 RepID=A0AA39YM49_9PEZI|nr:hypothetical protein QBC41DRAFT_386606 [Cercophora samala]